MRSRRTASTAAAVVVLGSALGMFAPRSGLALGRDPILLPGVDARQLDAGIAGWTASFAVTATGCGAAPCATLSAGWQAGVGAGGAGDGALAVTLRGVADHAGVAVATLRSPVFLAPAAPGSVDVSAAVRSRVVGGVSGGASSTVTVRLVDMATGERRTIVDAEPTGPIGGAWTDVRGDLLESGALKSFGVYRLEIDVRFQLAADAAPDTTVQLDRPTLAVEDLAAESPVGPVVVPTPSPTALPVGSEPVDDDADSDDAEADDPAPRCDEPLTVLGAGADGARLTIVGAADAEPGTAVDLRTTDGWRLGRSTVSASGTFSGSFRAPAAAGRARLVIARTSDGEASSPVAVQRKNVVRSVRRVAGAVVVDGTVARTWLRGERRVRLDLRYGDGDCAEPRTVHVGTVKIDVAGRYRAVLRAGSPGYQEVRGAEVVSARLTRPNRLGPPLRLDTPPVAVPRSSP